MKIPAFAPASMNDHPFFKSVPTLSPLAEQAAERGICPRCHTKTLRHVYQGGGMRFLQCKTCLVSVVLVATDNADSEGAKG